MSEKMGVYVRLPTFSSCTVTGAAVYGYLCQLIEANNSAALAHLAHVAHVLAVVVNTDMVAEDNLNARVTAILKQLAAHHPDAFAPLDPALQQKVHQAIQA